MLKSGLSAFLFCAIFVLGSASVSPAAWGTKELDTENSAVTFAREVERGRYKIVTTQELKKWIDEKKDVLIVDNNPYDSFKKQHYPGAVHFELPRPEMMALDDKTKAGLEKVLGPDKNRVIVFYCGFTECTRSHNGAMWATRLGYKNAYRQPGGIKAWNEADYPVEKAQ
ncbi:MAG TPA: rhodanese-like domain-containing protein [Syntrophales bacterium]|nr:rhodanese-like domain-containing protein [Syntrophales bacterium]